MKPEPSTPSRIAPIALVTVLSAGCAPAFTPVAVPTAAEVPALEARLAANSADVRALVRLAAAYHDAERATDAAALLERAAGLRPGDAGVVLYLGLIYQDLGRYEEARQAYEHFLDLGGPPATERHVRGRLRLLERQELLRAVRLALQREDSLAATEPQPRTVAVFPFLFAADDPDLAPLGRALAELLVRDLSQTDRMTVLERARVQLLLDELQLAEEGVVELATAARSGRLLGAGNIVQGSIQGGQAALRLDALVVAVGGEVDGRLSPLSVQEALARVFDMKTRLSLQIYESLDIELTPAERERIEQRRTSNVLALLEFGLGLEAHDAGLYATAADHFGAAAAADPEFEDAQTRATEAEEAAEAARTPTRDVVRRASEEIARITTQLDRLGELVPGFGTRDAASEVLGREGVVGPRSAVIEIVIPQR